MNTMEDKLSRHRLKIYFEDTDAGGVVYYANYLRYMERGRSEWLSELGFEQRRLSEEQQVGFIVRHVEISYKVPARLDDQLVVCTSPLSLGRAGLVLLQEVQFHESGSTAVSAKIDMVCISTQTMSHQDPS
ncbi:YbgC/FadM family acyl-CoA thioesterase [Leptolyngbya sp. FACHB-671]|uniref:YbgC/FadM family acyl-CoA thioesterase n=1 Tax=Leptolyngbya sp. FACHB-671 TaxID=2692812 RepID=UPI0018EF833C|nr:YbgC/FadM family acyl-CoA thioesterase [Leptolyngbya sp. FACHB-671]